MSYDIVSFHFNPIKTGQIIKQLRLDKKMSISCLARRCGTTYDTIDNIERGRVQDVKFEMIFKMCCVLETSIEVLMLLMLKDEDIDFIDQVLLYNKQEDEVIPATGTDIAPASVPDTVVAVAEAVAATDMPAEPVRKPEENPEHIAYLYKHIDHLTRLLELAITQKGA